MPSKSKMKRPAVNPAGCFFTSSKLGETWQKTVIMVDLKLGIKTEKVKTWKALLPLKPRSIQMRFIV